MGKNCDLQRNLQHVQSPKTMADMMSGINGQPTVPFHFLVLRSFIPLSPPLRTSTHQITPTAPQPAASLSSTMTRVSSRGTSSTCRSTTPWLFSGVSTSSSPWGSVRWRGPSPPITGPSPNQATSPCSRLVLALYAHSGRSVSCSHTS